MSSLAKVRPYLRSLSLEVCSLLTYTLAEAPESEDYLVVDYMTPPSIHYLLAHTHASLKLALASSTSAANAGPGRPSTALAAHRAAVGTGIATGHDLAQMDLVRMTPAALLEKVAPVLRCVRQHMSTLAALIPSAISEREIVDADAAFSLDSESETLQGRFVEPALLLAMQTLRLVLESRQLHDDTSQATLVQILSRFGHDATTMPQGHPLTQGGGEASQAPASSGEPSADPASACAAAFDFFDVLFSSLPSISLQSELIALCRAILDMLHRHEPDCEALSDRRTRIAALASSCLQRDRADDRDFTTWHSKKPLPSLVRTLFDVHAAYSEAPRELLHKWTSDYLPELDEPSVDESEPMAIDACPLFNRSSAPHFISILFNVLTEEGKRLALPAGDSWKKAEKKDADPPLEADEVADRLETLKGLSDAFVQLVLSTRVVTSKQLNKVAITHSARFIQLINKRALPMMSAHFKLLNTQVMGLLKSLQPATRLLQVHCSMVKANAQIAALNSAASLKKELEAIIFEVKVLLQTHDCRESFWMGNLKHKDLHGQEISSQMEPAWAKSKAEGKKPAKAGKRKAVAEEEEEEGGATEEEDDDEAEAEVGEEDVDELDDEEEEY